MLANLRPAQAFPIVWDEFPWKMGIFQWRLFCKLQAQNKSALLSHKYFSSFLFEEFLFFSLQRRLYKFQDLKTKHTISMFCTAKAGNQHFMLTYPRELTIIMQIQHIHRCPIHTDFFSRNSFFWKRMSKEDETMNSSVTNSLFSINILFFLIAASSSSSSNWGKNVMNGEGSAKRDASSYEN